MLVTYTAPTRAHHYPYAKSLVQAGCLHAFVSGFPRISPRASLPELRGKLIRVDFFETISLLGQRCGIPDSWFDELSYWSKLSLDRRSLAPAKTSNLFLFYNGCGLSTLRKVKPKTICVVEVVNSHVLTQETILREESARLNLKFRSFHPPQVRRRVAEYNEADYILCPSEFVRNSFLERGFDGRKILKVPYGFTARSTSDQHRNTGKVFRVLYVGQVAVRKGLRYLLSAFEQLQHPNKELWIVGAFTKVTGIEGCPIPQGVKFMGILKDEFLADAYRQSSVFVQPSLEEGLSLVIGEALSHGLPVIATVNTGATDLFQNGVEGWHVPIRETAAITEKLQQLADDNGLLEAMSEKALARSVHLGGWEQSGKLLLDTLRSLAMK